MAFLIPVVAKIGISFVASGILSLLQPTQRVEQPAPEDQPIPPSGYGTPIPLFWGVVPLQGIPVWRGPREVRKITTKQSAKGGPTIETTENTVYQSFAVLFGRTELSGIRKIYFNNNPNPVYNFEAEDEETLKASQEFASYFRLISGKLDQPIDPIVSAIEGIDADNWAGRCGLVFDTLNLTQYSGGTIPTVTIEGYTTRLEENISLERLVGNAASIGDRFQLTPNSKYKKGALWYSEPINSLFSGFEIIFIIEADKGENSQHADGIVLAIQSQGFVVGDDGENMGYGGIDGPSIGLAFSHKDPNQRLRLLVDGDLDPVLEDANFEFLGTQFYVFFEYVVGSLKIFVSNTASKPSVPKFTYAVNLESKFPNNAFIGATAATGERTSFHYLYSLSINGAEVIFPGSRVEPVPLNRILSEILENEIGYAADEYSLIGLDDIFVQGSLTSGGETRDFLSKLSAAFFFDSIEADKLRFIRRGFGTNQPPLPLSKQGAYVSGTDRPRPFTETIDDVDRQPSEVKVGHLDPIRQYGRSIQSAKRFVSGTNDSRRLDLPIVLTAQETQTIADRELYLIHSRRRKIKVSLGPEYWAVRPGDSIDLEIDGTFRNLFVEETTRGANWIIEVTGFFQSGVLSHESTIPASNSPYSETIPFEGNITVDVIYCNRVFDTDPELCGYCFFGGGDWRTGSLYVSRDGGINYQQLLTIAEKSVKGTTVNELGTSLHTVFDNKNYLDVEFPASVSFGSVARDSLFFDPRLNILAVETLAGNFELIRFSNAIAINQSQWRFSGLIRGFRGTENFIGGHGPGLRVFSFSDYHAVITITPDQLGSNVFIKAPRTGQVVSDVDESSTVPQPTSKRPYAPDHIEGIQDINGDWSISWFRRARLNNLWLDGTDVPLDETIEQYKLRVYDGSNNVIRTIDVFLSDWIEDRASYRYTTAMQLSDFGSIQNQLLVGIAMFSSFPGIGNGYEKQSVIG